MIVEINYTALQFDNHQGGSGRPITGRILCNVDCDATLSELNAYSSNKLAEKKETTIYTIGNYELINIVIG